MSEHGGRRHVASGGGAGQVVQRGVMGSAGKGRQVGVDAVVGRRLGDVHRAESVFQVAATAHLLRHRHQCCVTHHHRLI